MNDEDAPTTKKKLQLNGPESERNGILVSRIMLASAIISSIIGVAGMILIPFDTVLENVGRQGANIGPYAFILLPIGAFMIYKQLRKGVIENRAKNDDAKTSIAMLNTGTVFACLFASPFVLGQLAFLHGFAVVAGLW
ncbi:MULTISPECIES: hypothetical protein [Micrococcaceae]|uniref:hypothetical protein n=1 Tax=Micrococcaceae TaxID=1268 RepID=UPI00103673B2|nr:MULTISPECIES: hypothetical protein [Micrococcaceae]TAP25224.1 hypothetical protein EYR88_15310 [Arthrobacter sp. S41]UXN32202.1 hypothetical protein N6V40_01480 [Glutamicibacter sp. M10]